MTAKSTTRKPRRTREQIAQDNLDQAQRVVSALDEKRLRLQQELADLKYDLDEAMNRRDWLAAHPALTKAQPADEETT